jgi:putative CocE/NonD family hydrolase
VAGQRGGQAPGPYPAPTRRNRPAYTRGLVSLASEILGRRLGLIRPLTRDVEVTRDLRVPMDDGAVLLADRFAPRDAPPGPTVLVRSAYGREGAFGLILGRLIAERGLPSVVQSVRGTFGSEGEFSPFDERADGLATLRWLRKQPWHNGPIGMTGSSYMGLTQWAVARDAGPDLVAITPSITASEFFGQAQGNGALTLETALSWIVVMAMQEGRLGPVRTLRRLVRLARIYGELPLADLDERATGRAMPFYREWFEHRTRDDPYWAARDFSAGVEEVTAAVQLVGGWQDMFLPWLLADYEAVRRAGRPDQLIVGPWAHTSPDLMGASLRAALAWLRAHLVDDRRLLDPAPVKVWVGGAHEWRALDAWPPAAARERRLHLQPDFGLDDAAPPDGGRAGPDSYRYDPADPTPSVGGPTLFVRSPVTDNRKLEARDDVLVYSGEPLAADLEVIGPVRADIYVRSTRPTFDVFARLCDVRPDGFSRNVCDALTRVETGRHERLDDGTVRVAFDLWPTAHRFRAGHRIRVLIAGGAHPRYARNPGVEGDPATTTELVAGDQEVFHDPARPSAVTLSVLE